MPASSDEVNLDLIWIVEAAMKYKRSRDWIDKKIRSGELDKYSIDGDRKVYISRQQLEALLQPRTRPRGGQSSSGAASDPKQTIPLNKQTENWTERG